jgi:hypothetical protein
MFASFGWNSWIAMNASWWNTEVNFEPFAELTILAVAVVIIATVLWVFRLLPTRWTLRGRSFRDRTWPAFVICVIVMSLWFASAAMPYRLPEAVDEVAPELTILHVQKRGLQFHETAMRVYKDSRFFCNRNNRRLFQYRFQVDISTGVLPHAISQRAFSLARSPQLNSMKTLPPKPLRAWNAEGWYVRIPTSGEVAFTSEYGTTPPREVVDLFQQIEAVVPNDRWPERFMKDVCLGFCYDPLAGLGVLYPNQRCHTDASGKLSCR